jgi:ATP-binding cassette, subfamily B, bacterial MsbA
MPLAKKQRWTPTGAQGYLDPVEQAVNPSADKPTPGVWGRLARDAVLPYLGRFVLAGICMLLVALSTAALAWLMNPVVDKVFVERRADLLWLVGGAVFACFAVKGVAAYGQTIIMSQVGQTILTDLQNRLFSHILSMDLAFFAVNKTGALISRMTTDINSMRQAVSTALTGLGREIMSVIFLIAVMFYQDWILAAIAFVAFPPSVIGVTGLGRRLRRVTADTQEQTGTLMTLAEQSFTGIRVVKAYGLESYEAERVKSLSTRIRDIIIKAERIKAIASPLMETLGGVAVTIVIVYGGWRVISGVTTAGAFFSFITALLMAYRPMKALANANAQVNEGLAGAERLYAVLDLRPGVADAPAAQPLVTTRGELVLENVSFSYGDGIAALNGLSLTAPQGRTTALVGPSGAGKSTVFNLLLRFYEPTQGRVIVDGQDTSQVTMASLRHAIAFVGQDVVLFDDSVRANIGYGRPSATADDIIAAAKAAGAHDFIMALPQGYDTVVGERGQSLSGGQRQRVAIARAILKNAPILLLDEATSALDTETEHIVQAALERLMKGRTTIVIAHRLSTISRADQICVLDGGKIVDRGRHADLMGRGGLYQRLYQLQFAGTPHAVAAD